MGSSPNTYRATLIAFLDVSGLKEAVQKSLNKPKLAKEIESMLLGLQDRCTKLNKDPQWGPKIPDLKARAFSDSIILTCPVDSNDSTVLDNALRKIAVISSAFQMEVALHDFFIRGAITVGLHCDRADVFFGPALIEAYEAERQLANWFRVIVLPKALDLRAHGRHPYLITDNAGITYIDYLLLCTASLLFQSNDPKYKQAGLHPYSWLSLMEGHKTALERVVRTLNIDSPQFLITLSKYHSLAHYHNRCLRQILQGGKDFPLTELLELILSRQKGMTKNRMDKEISEWTHFHSDMQERQKNCLIDTRTIFAPLRRRGSRRNI